MMTKMNKLIKQDTQLEFDEETVELIKSQIAIGATDKELQLFLYQARRAGLDPLARQIYFIKRGEKAVIQTSIDGFRLVAQRSGEYGGQDAPEWFKTGEDELYCRVNVYKFHNDQRYLAAVGVAYWNEYCPMYNGKPGAMWAKMPRTMIAKVAEALALRKAFPQELSGLYTSEEMDQANDEPKKDIKPIAEDDYHEPVELLKETETTLEVVEGMELKEDNKCTCGTTGIYHAPGCPARKNAI